VLSSNFKLTPARRIQLRQAGIRLQQIIARLAVLDAEFRKLNPPRPNKPL
jgi:hypothetical protein